MHKFLGYILVKLHINLLKQGECTTVIIVLGLDVKEQIAERLSIFIFYCFLKLIDEWLSFLWLNSVVGKLGKCFFWYGWLAWDMFRSIRRSGILFFSGTAWDLDRSFSTCLIVRKLFACDGLFFNGIKFLIILKVQVAARIWVTLFVFVNEVMDIWV